MRYRQLLLTGAALLTGALALGVTSCDMMLEGGGGVPVYGGGAPVYSDPSLGPWFSGFGNGGWNIGLAPVVGPAPVTSPLKPLPNPSTVPAQPVYGPSLPAGGGNNNSTPAVKPPAVNTPSTSPGSGGGSLNIPSTGQRPGSGGGSGNQGGNSGGGSQPQPLPATGRH